MKKALLLTALLLLAFTSAQAQWGSKKVRGNGNMVTETRSTSDYEKIHVVGSMNVKLVSGSEGNIKVAAESNLQEYILTEVKNGTLKISTEKGVNLQTRKDLLITVPVESVNAISLTGSGDIWTQDSLSEEELSVSVTGSGDMVLDIKSKYLKGQVTGSGDIKIKGSSENFECNVTGSGDFDAFDLKAKHVEARVSGSGDVMVYAASSLKANVSGSGDIVYKGDPEKQNFKTNGSGKVSSY
ncbi:head GIN domain-containing protein [Christiangramia portivictoriae]|uniref:head GIN domain-containing protein n=1 Tax=Christiangramia portivictoriae TaxID=326069 RepID=UPI00041CB2E2|nr:head GIN domain-containing protein [Christiangramia portivictoriae]